MSVQKEEDPRSFVRLYTRIILNEVAASFRYVFHGDKRSVICDFSSGNDKIRDHCFHSSFPELVHQSIKKLTNFWKICKYLRGKFLELIRISLFLISLDRHVMDTNVSSLRL